MTPRDATQYEIAASWWAGSCSWGWAQTLAAWHYRRKTARKFRRYARHVAWLDRNGRKLGE